MLRILRTLFDSPETGLWILAQAPAIIIAILIIRLGHFIWSNKVSAYRGTVLAGVVLIFFSYIAGFFTNYIFIPRMSEGSHETIVLIIQINAFLGNMGHLLFIWGLFKFFTKEWKKEEETDIVDNLIERKE